MENNGGAEATAGGSGRGNESSGQSPGHGDIPLHGGIRGDLIFFTSGAGKQG